MRVYQRIQFIKKHLGHLLDLRARLAPGPVLFNRASALLFLTWITTYGSGCTTSLQGTVPTQLMILSGDAQTAQVTTAVGEDLVVALTNDAGQPVASFPVSWTVTRGGTVTAATGTTDALGQISAKYTVGTKSGEDKVTVSVPTLGITKDFTINVTPAAAYQLVFSKQPAATWTAGVATNSSNAPIIELQDRYGNPLTSSNRMITVSLTKTGDPDIEVYSAVASTGKVVLLGFSLTQTVVGYSLTATSPGLISTSSAPLTILPGQAARVAFTQEPGSTAVAGTNFATQPIVQIQDDYGNPLGPTDGYRNDTIELTAYTTSNCSTTLGTGTLANNSIAAVNGTATFSNVNYTKAQTIYLKARDTTHALASDCTVGSIAVSPGTPTTLAFTTQPQDTKVSTVLPSFAVSIFDAYGNTVTTASDTVTISFGNNAGGGTLSGTLSAATSSGVATFTNVLIDSIAIGYTLRASGGTYSLGGVLSSTFTILRGISTYVVNSGNNTVSQYVFNSTGHLSALSPATEATGNTPSAIAVTPSGNYAYVVNGGDNTVSQFSVSPATTKLVALTPATVATGALPSGMAITPNGAFAYVINRTDMTVSQYSIDTNTGLLTPLTPATIATGTAPFSITITPNGSFAYVINRDDNTVSQYAIDPVSGLLSALTPASVTTASVPTGMAITRNGAFAYVANFIGNSISLFSVSSGGQLVPLSPATISTGAGPYSIGISLSGNTAYVLNRTDNTIAQLAIQPSTGALSPLTPATVAAGNAPSSIANSPDGNFVYVTNHDDHTVSQFSVASVTEKLSPLSPATVATADTAAAIAVAASVYSPAGVQNNVPIANLNGWTQCFSSTYAATTTDVTGAIATACPLGSHFLIACGQAGNPNYEVLSWVSRTTLLTQTVSTTVATLDPAGGAYWYFNPTSSIGFAESSTIALGSCDTSSPSSTTRVCWNTLSSGYRCGASVGLSTSAWTRAIYYK